MGGNMKTCSKLISPREINVHSMILTIIKVGKGKQSKQSDLHKPPLKQAQKQTWRDFAE